MLLLNPFWIVNVQTMRSVFPFLSKYIFLSFWGMLSVAYLVVCVTYSQDEPELYFTEPQQLLDLVTQLREQNLSLIQNCTRGEETVEELRRVMETTKKKM